MSPFLKKSFNSVKCKTLLQLTVQKLKILTKKHALCVKTSRADAARLLEKGQDSSAKTQVDIVFREEKFVALYNLLEQFCQHVINRLESIKSERECPSELKEAVTSLIYAASGCGEIEELKKISSYLTNKYGTEFSLAAKELRSGCGVNTQVIQNLSSLPLSSDARMRLLKDIATEHKINWDYDTTTADTSKQSVDLLDGPSHFVSGTQISNVSIHSISDKQKSASMSMHENEVNGRASGVLKNAFSSHILSPKTSLGSPLHNMHQPTKINTNTQTKHAISSSRVQNVPSDPYSLAKAEGKMDYKFVSDYMGREHTPLDSKNSIKLAQHEGQSPSRGSSKVLFNKQMSTAGGRQAAELTLLEVEAASKLALASASEAAEAARAAVALVRKETLERNRLENTKKPYGRNSKSSSVPVLEESSSGPIKDESRFSPTWENSAQADTSEDSFKYVVCEQSSGSLQDAAIIAEHTELRSSELPVNPSMDNFYSTDVKEQEVDWKTSYKQQEEGLYINKEIQQDIFLQNVVPQFDEDDSEEEETPMYPLKSASLKQQHESLFGEMEVQQDKHVQNVCSVPQFDDDSGEEASMEETPLNKDVRNECLVPQFDDDKNKEASEEETPFYLKGRPAMVKEDSCDEIARAPSSKRMTRTGLFTDDWMEESLSMKRQGTDEELSPCVDYREELLNFSINMDEHEGGSVHSQELTESVHSPNQSLKSSPRSQINAVGGRSGLTSPFTENSSFDGRQNMKWISLSPEYSSYNKLPSLVSSVRPLSPTESLLGYEDGDPSSRVRRNSKWCSTISEDSDFALEKSVDSYRPGSMEESSLHSPKALEDGPRAFELDFGPSTQAIQASPKKYHGMSRRSVRSTRPRQKQEIPSPTT